MKRRHRLRRPLEPSFRRPDPRYLGAEYSEALSVPVPPLVRELVEETRALEGRRADMISSPVQGEFLQTLVAVSGARRVLELGTYTGFSAAIYDRCLALLAPKGVLVIDNVLARGAAVDLSNERGRAADALNRRIAADERVRQVMLTVRDGLMLVRRAGA